MAAGDFAYWRQLAAANIRTADSDLLDRIARHCVQAIEDGFHPSIWHSLSEVTGKPCHCMRCSRAVR